MNTQTEQELKEQTKLAPPKPREFDAYVSLDGVLWSTAESKECTGLRARALTPIRVREILKEEGE